MNIDEYLESIEDKVRRGAIESALNAALECIEWEFRYLPEEQRNLNYSVLEDESIMALGSEDYRLIQFSTGLIDHFERARFPDIRSFVTNAPLVMGASLVLNVGVAWCLSHEFAHIYRKHDSAHNAIKAAVVSKVDVGNGFRSALSLTESSLSKAFEHDADLCATAKIYRYIQRRCSSVVDDITIRKMALFYIYWGLRTFPQSHDSDSHPAVFERLYEVTQKLAQLPTDQSLPYIVGQDLDLQLMRVTHLFNVAIALEKAYIDISGKPEIDAYWYRWFSHIDNKQHTQRAKDWQKVSPWVQQVSGTAADNRKDIFYYKRKSAWQMKKRKKAKRKNEKVARRKSR
ncbi:hypothetical protein B1F69_24765 [Pseudomonas syringae]|uniref:hypothetical protein n=1 Tax=Pseudomonas syringae TaxID=317 RepID=UPI0010119317|nr:hypothetical protein [Pseudomonas syringae]RXT85547.1 hypothetical protein B1F69_24765 [Pseudomonas syringae]